MSSVYTLTINIDPTWTTAWKEKDMKLCIGAPVYEKQRYVVTRVIELEDIEQQIKVSWTDELKVAAFDKGFRAGSIVKVPENGWTPIEYESVATFAMSDGQWTCKIDDQGSGPQHGIGFQNSRNPATCVLGKFFDDAVRPIYVSPVLLPPSGKGYEKIVVDNVVVVWFDKNVQEGQLIDTANRIAPETVRNVDLSTTKEASPPDYRTKYRFYIMNNASDIWFDKLGYWQSWDPARTEDLEDNT